MAATSVASATTRGDDSPAAATVGLDAKSSAGGKRAGLKALLPSSFVERTLFQVAHTIIRDGAIPKTLAWAIAIIEDVQLLSFIFLRSLHSSIPSALESALTLFIVPTTYPSFVVADTLVDSSPASANPLACSNGHVNLQSVMLRVALVVLKVFLASETGAAVWVYMCVAATGFAYQSRLLVMEQPYYDRGMNMFRTVRT
ncbi:hypothetical protein BCR44DRAFT_1509223 [Catenaria anguillulae PL171]|uniref:Uncharacterized protein n=1 Tax=Catenaria anguillulae PL171 TaxID=765915 RepID=A0A1Y2I1U7_9FUNG|nr:hypothetical protein BCR44DRAFT_1509223 [Catenaria anguillulae PL171]